VRGAALVLASVLAFCGCATQSSKEAPLLDTYWRLAGIDGKTVAIHAGAREPHIVLRGEGSRISGFAGCNGFAGSFRHEGTMLRVGDKLAMTRMACVGEGDALEAAFAKALTSVAAYRIAGDRLELYDAQGAVRMVFEARGSAPAR
jgi:heat shock protein HslJ